MSQAVLVQLSSTLTFDDDHWQVDPIALAPSLRRLGERFARRGDRRRALHYYNQFVDLWKSADAELQAQIRAAREQIALLRIPNE